MASPAFIFRYLTDAQWAEVQAYALQVMMGGQITGLSGGAKSSTYAVMDTQQFLIEYKAEYQRRTGTIPPVKVYSNFRRNNVNGI